jgi:hypothetical protein
MWVTESHHVAKALSNEACMIRYHCFAFGLCKQTCPVLSTRVLKLKFFASPLPDILLIMPFIRVRTGIISQDCQVSGPRLFQRPTMPRLDRWDEDLKELGKCHCVTLPSSAVHNQPTALSGVLKNWIFYSNIYPTKCNVTRFILSGNCSKCFGWYHYPSSGAQTTVSTASGICHTVTATCRKQ